jgi:hypothetical protein
VNLIEQLGGYEYLNGFYKRAVAHGFTLTEIKEELLKYRRQHNIFEVGDKVIITQNIWGEPPPDNLCYVFNNKDHHIVGVGIDISVGFGSSSAYRHATDAEIKAGKRLEVKSEN